MNKIMAALAWFQIFVSPMSVGIIAALIAYYGMPGTTGKILAVFLIITGIAIGILFAEKMSRKGGAFQFMNKVNASADLDEAIKEQPNEDRNNTVKK